MLFGKRMTPIIRASVLVIFSFFLNGKRPLLVPVCNFFYVYHRNKISENYVEFHFRMGTVHVISFSERIKI